MNQQLRVLVVDDTRLNLVLMEAMLEKMGYIPIMADSGMQALEIFQQEQPDVVLMDVMMPGMDGYQTVRELRRIADTWVPIIFVSAMTQTADLVEGIHAGGDDYLFKPINYEVLRAKIGLFNDRVQMSRTLIEQNRVLLDYQARTDEEKQTAQEFIHKLTALDDIKDPAVQFFLQAAESFSGDLIAVARTPSNQLHVLLADSTGHGLTASLAVTPVLQPFHAMTAKGFSIAAIAAEINRKVKEYLPIHRFVAAVFVSFDIANQAITVWNGGCPPVVLINAEGLLVHQFDSTHVPLGIMSAQEFDASLEHYHLPDDKLCQLMLCSDGTVDALDFSSMGGGMKQLLSATHIADRNARFANMVALIKGTLDGLPASDDVALIMVDCFSLNAAIPVPVLASKPVKPSLPVKSGGVSEQPSASVSWEFWLMLTAVQLRELDVVPMMLNLVRQIEVDGSESMGKLFMVLSELFNNALDHGLLKLDSKLKHDPEGMEHYYLERAARLSQLSGGSIRLDFERKCGADRHLVVRVKDTGEGFDYHTQLTAEARLEERHGRGIMLVKDICSSVSYLGNGSEVVVTLDI